LFQWEVRNVSRSLSKRQALALGVVILLGLLLAGLGLFAVGSRGWLGQDALQVQVSFPEIKGVEVGTRVRIQGMDAGEVVSITPPNAPSQPVLLGLRVRGNFRHLVRQNSRVQIVSEGMIGGKVLEIVAASREPGQSFVPPDNGPADEQTVLHGETPREASDVLAELYAAVEQIRPVLAEMRGGVAQIRGVLAGVENGKGTLGKLTQDPEAYQALVALLRTSTDAVEKSKDTLANIQRDADAIKRVPWIGGYLHDPVRILVRPASERHRQYLAEEELFEPGRAVLTPAGRERLDKLAPWLADLKQSGSDVVVVSYADPQRAPLRQALEVTQKQSEAVADYLKTKHSVHKLGWFSSRKVTPLGQGTLPPPIPESTPLPPGRVEILIFVPQS
jgi:phospholipid/cholesterol/gamma-HCH transport system substrate-binding protein